MPELPEVETIVRALAKQLPGRRVLRTSLTHRTLYRRGSLAMRWLVQKTVEDVNRVGKNAVIWFDPVGVMVVNLGMTGRLVTRRRSDRMPPGSRKHLHGRLYLDGGFELLYYDPRRFGHFYIAKRCDFANDLNIGPDPFVVGLSYLQEALEGRTTSIKALLLDQRVLSGIGNIYADETLFHAGVDPRTPAGIAGKHAAKILSSAQSVLTSAIEHGGSTLRDYRRPDGSRGNFQFLHAVYGRGGEMCLRCKARVRKIVLAGRGTHFCPRCQK